MADTAEPNDKNETAGELVITALHLLTALMPALAEMAGEGDPEALALHARAVGVLDRAVALGEKLAANDGATWAELADRERAESPDGKTGFDRLLERRARARREAPREPWQPAGGGVVSREHVHEWTDWYLPIWYRDSLGHLVGDVGLARLGGADEPVTDGWARVCRTCDTEQRS